MSTIPRHYQGLEELINPADDLGVTTFTYGDHAAHVCDLRLPAGGETAGVVALLHGGAWQTPWDRLQLNAVAAHLTRNGWVTWNMDYRAVGNGGGYPATLQDVADAMDLLDDVGRDSGFSTARVVVAGHSAGGQLAMWAAGRPRFPAAALGSAPRVAPAAAVSMSGLLDLVGAARQTVAGMVAAFLGGSPDERSEHYAAASPAELVPLGIPQLVIHGTVDGVVPLQQAGRYVELARAAGDDVTFLTPDVDHDVYLYPQSPVWQQVMEWIRGAC